MYVKREKVKPFCSLFWLVDTFEKKLETSEVVMLSQSNTCGWGVQPSELDIAYPAGLFVTVKTMRESPDFCMRANFGCFRPATNSLVLRSILVVSRNQVPQAIAGVIIAHYGVTFKRPSPQHLLISVCVGLVGPHCPTIELRKSASCDLYSTYLRKGVQGEEVGDRSLQVSPIITCNDGWMRTNP